ncbi:hypothetical protein BC829DRAFT_393881 [Chytridium lagenaria]|nr:hypothetical protein BC829DRAFT_393881 [Chytridium lagenaria]
MFTLNQGQPALPLQLRHHRSILPVKTLIPLALTSSPFHAATTISTTQNHHQMWTHPTAPISPHIHLLLSQL